MVENVHTETAEKQDKEIATIKVDRVNNSLVLKLKILPEIEGFFKSDEIRESQNWGNGQMLKFYRKQTLYSDSTEKGRFLGEYYDDFGSQFINGNKVNIAILRTVGSSDGFIELNLDNKYSEESLVSGVKELKNFILLLYKKFVKPIKIECSLQVVEII